jgi:hypothetical protein
MVNPRVLLAVGVLVFLVLAGVIALVGRALRSSIDGSDRKREEKAPDRNRDWAVTPMPTGLARTLTERGLVNAQQLASMSAAEREFFVATVAARVGEGAKPKLVNPSTGTVGAQPPSTPEIAPTAALVSGAIHCPVCRTPLGQRSETPLLMSRCPGCSRRIAIRVEGDKLTVTVQYGAAQTPAVGTPVVG